MLIPTVTRGNDLFTFFKIIGFCIKIIENDFPVLSVDFSVNFSAVND